MFEDKKYNVQKDTYERQMKEPVAEYGLQRKRSDLHFTDLQSKCDEGYTGEELLSKFRPILKDLFK